MSSEEPSGWGKLGEAWRKIQDAISTNSASSNSLPNVEDVLDDQKMKINDMVYELYSPKDGDKNMEIVFFHGLRPGACSHPHINTWMSRSEPAELWPRTWLGESFPKARILSVSYDSRTTEGSTHGRLDLHLLAENLFLALIRLRLARVGQTWGCPVVMVGHCLGGLLIKQMCVFVARKEFNLAPDRETAQHFLENMRGVYLFASPQQGINFIESFKGLRNSSPLSDALRILDKETGRLNQDFQHYRTKNNWGIEGVGESNQTRISANPVSFLYSVMVEEASARFNMDNYFTVNADHFDICRPVDRKDVSFQALEDFIRKVTTKDVSKALPFFKPPRHGGVGLDTRVEKVRNILKGEEKIAIVGMGGIGKTTLAKAVFNEMFPRFEYSCFVENLKGELRVGQSVDSLVMANLHRGGRKVPLQPVDVWSFLEGKLLLLVLDDVDSREQIDSIPEPGWLLRQSRVIVTSRFRSDEIFQGEFFLYDTPFLTDVEARQLFCTYASKSGEMSDNLVSKVVDKCEGLPLTLEVIGSNLRTETSEGTWQDVLLKLSNAESISGSVEDKDRLWSKLRTSFDTLAHIEKVLFLDCASFVAGYAIPLSYIKAAWGKSFPRGATEAAWKNLVNRSLVSEIDLDNYASAEKGVGMHEQLQDMGRSIACPLPGTSHLFATRVWERRKALQLLTDDAKGQTNLIEGLRTMRDGEDDLGPVAKVSHAVLSSRRDGEDYVLVAKISHFVLAKMLDLRYLALEDISLVGNGPAFPPNLAYLLVKESWREQLPWFGWSRRKRWIIHESDLSNLARSLVVLTVVDLNVGGILPKNLGRLVLLQVLEIAMLELEAFPDSLCELFNLKHLYICSPCLECLPASFGGLASLRTLELMWCSCLTHLPDSFWLLNSLQVLRILHCRRLQTLPNNLASLPELSEVELGRDFRYNDGPIRNVIDLASDQLASFGWVNLLGTVTKKVGGMTFQVWTFSRKLGMT